MSPRIRVFLRDTAYDLNERELTIIPSGSVVIVLENYPVDSVRFDGRIWPVRSIRGARILAVDLTRSTGFHHLHIDPGHDFWFGTEDSKLRLDGIEKMLRYIRSEGLAWSGQLMFSDGTYTRDPYVTYGWLDDHADQLVEAAELIANRPARRASTERRLTARGGSRLALKPTMSLLRRRGKELLDRVAGGPIPFEGESYSPLKVVAKFRLQTLDTLANRRVVSLVSSVDALVESIQPFLAQVAEQERCRAWRIRLNRILRNSLLAPLHPVSSEIPPGAGRTIDELVDPRYSLTYQGSLKLSSLTGWTAIRERRDAYAYVGYSDEIYQAFVGYVVAEALGLSTTAEALGLKQPAFTSENMEIYYDTAPPRHILRTWRSYTRRPDDVKPDFLFHFLHDGSVVLADAKYRSDGHRASESSRRDLMLYMQAYQLNHSIIFYPPQSQDLRIYTLAAHDYEIAEVPVLPVPGAIDFLRGLLPPLLERIRLAPAWHA